MSIICQFHHQKENFKLDFEHTLKYQGVNIITGASGVGKTTLLRLMLGLEKDRHGVFIVGNTVYQNDKTYIQTEKRSIGYVGETTTLLPFLNVEKNLRFSQKRSLSQNKTTPKLEELLDVFDTLDCLKKHPKQLSSGQKQRICVIQSLLNNPELFLLDEAFSAIDEKRKNLILDYLLKYFQKEKKSVIYVSHDQQEIEYIKQQSPIYEIELISGADQKKNNY